MTVDRGLTTFATTEQTPDAIKDALVSSFLDTFRVVLTRVRFDAYTDLPQAPHVLDALTDVRHLLLSRRSGRRRPFLSATLDPAQDSDFALLKAFLPYSISATVTSDLGHELNVYDSGRPVTAAVPNTDCMRFTKALDAAPGAEGWRVPGNVTVTT